MAAIDPAWAWAEFTPAGDTPWSPALAAHLYRRVGFAATVDELNTAASQTPGEVIDRLLAVSGADDGENDTLAKAALASGNPRALSSWWAYRMMTEPRQALEKLTLFWHGHFATSAAKVTDARLMFVQNQLLRRHAFGNFGELVHDISRDAAMLLWLDSATNRKAHPNENFAREIMELFCLGEGEYSETDIRELARCFTGWEIKASKFRFNRFQHDTGNKPVLGRTGEFGGDEGVDIVLEQAALPRFIVRKLIRFYVRDEPAATDELIEPLAVEFRASGLQIQPLLRRILASNLFFSRHSVGRKVRSPAELAFGFLRALEVTTNVQVITEGLSSLGQELFYPPNVKGWDGGRTWINSSTLLGRANLIRKLLDNSQTRFAKGRLSDLVDRHGLSRGDAVVGWFEKVLFAVPLPADVREQVARVIDSNAGDRETRLRNALHQLCTLPEFQLA